MSCWPDPVQSLLLRGGLLSGDDRAGALSVLEDLARREGLPAGNERLLPLVYLALRDAAEDFPSLMGIVEPVYLRSWQRSEVQAVMMARALAALNGAAIPSIVLKGPTLSCSYGDPALRPASDLDILTSVERYEDALAALSLAGWRTTVDPPGDAVLHHALNLSGPAVDIDLHRHALEEFVGTTHDLELWESSEPFVIHDHATRSLSAGDRLIHVFAHGLRWNPTSNVHWIADALLLLRAEGEGFDWERFAHRARVFDLTLPVWEGLRYLAQSFEIVVPRAVTLDLAASRPSPIRRLAYAARQRAPGDRGILDATALRVEMRRRRLLALDLPAPAAFASSRRLLSIRGVTRTAEGVWRALRVSLSSAIRRS